MASSPPALPSLASNRAQAIESLITKKPKRGLESLDDASSLTSMSSKSDSTICRICKKGESLTARLTLCVGCGNGFHEGCPNPRILDPKKEYTCQRCVEKQKQEAPEKKESEKPQVCAIPNCRKQIFTHVSKTTQGSSRLLCVFHRIGERNILAKAQMPTSNPTSGPRPFQKEKLYTVRPDDRPLLKRKRSESGKKSHSAGSSTESRTAPVQKPMNAARKSGAAIPPPRKKTQKSPQKKTAGSRPAARRDTLPPNIEAFGRLLEAGIMTQPPNEMSPTERTSSPRLISPARMALQLEESPEYEPPPPSGIDNLSSLNDFRNDTYEPPPAFGIDDLPSEVPSPFHQGEGRDESPSSQITSEMRATVEEVDPGSDVPLVSILNPIEERTTQLYNPIEYPTIPRELESPLPEEDEEMHDADRFNSQHFSSPTKQTSESSSPMSPSSPNIPHLRNHDLETEMELDFDQSTHPEAVTEEHSITLSRMTISERVSEKAKPFDESILDSFLKKMTPQDPLHGPTPKELLDTQRWGFIDPRIVWPRRLTPIQKEAKMVEIASRGTRKSRFGKILTPQVIEERAENGWDIHQSCERRDDEDTIEMIQKLEELFGAQGMGNCVPRSVGGKLVMQEREKEPESRRPGRQKKEVPLKAYPVIGGQ